MMGAAFFRQTSYRIPRANSTSLYGIPGLCLRSRCHRYQPVAHHGFLQLHWIRSTPCHVSGHLSKVRGAKDSGAQDAETDRRVLFFVTEPMDYATFDEDRLAWTHGDIPP